MRCCLTTGVRCKGRPLDPRPRGRTARQPVMPGRADGRGNDFYCWTPLLASPSRGEGLRRDVRRSAVKARGVRAECPRTGVRSFDRLRMTNARAPIGPRPRGRTARQPVRPGRADGRGNDFYCWTPLLASPSRGEGLRRDVRRSAVKARGVRAECPRTGVRSFDRLRMTNARAPVGPWPSSARTNGAAARESVGARAGRPRYGMRARRPRSKPPAHRYPSPARLA